MTRWILFMVSLLLLPALRASAVEVSLSRAIWAFPATTWSSWLVVSVTGAETIGSAELEIDLGPFDATEISSSPVLDATFLSEEGHFQLFLSKSGPGIPEHTVEIAVTLDRTMGRDLGCGYGPIPFLRADFFGLRGEPVSDVILDIGSWYIYTDDVVNGIDVVVLQAETLDPIEGARVRLEAVSYTHLRAHET